MTSIAAFTPAKRQFSVQRRAPLNVLHIEAAKPLVRHGGGGLRDLREDVFDAAFNTNCHARAVGADTYATAMMGGEPYAIWN